MFKRLVLLVSACFVLINLCGCLLMMGALADTAHAKQNINLGYGDALEIVKTTLKAQGIRFESAEITKDIAEVKGYAAGDRVIRIYVSRVSDTESTISVRAGTSLQGNEEAKRILAAIVEASGAKPPVQELMSVVEAEPNLK